MVADAKLETLSKSKLLELAKVRGVAVPSGIDKSDLVALLVREGARSKDNRRKQPVPAMTLAGSGLREPEES